MHAPTYCPSYIKFGQPCFWTILYGFLWDQLISVQVFNRKSHIQFTLQMNLFTKHSLTNQTLLIAVWQFHILHLAWNTVHYWRLILFQISIILSETSSTCLAIQYSTSCSKHCSLLKINSSPDINDSVIWVRGLASYKLRIKQPCST